jgi:IMP dehydrogenase
MASHMIEEALTFNDVSLVPAYSEVLPTDVDLSVNFNDKLRLSAPILSAAMDTVTTSQMAIAMAQAGALGVIHKNLTIAEQAREVVRVKKYEAGVISDPVTIGPEATIAEARALMDEHGVSGFPVVEPSGHLLGMLTNRDIRFAQSQMDLVREHMSTDLVKARIGESTNICIDLMKNRRIEKLPLVDANHRLRGLVTLKDMDNVNISPDSVRDQKGRLRCGVALGCGDDLEERAHALVEAGADALVIDVAHGHSSRVKTAVESLRRWFKDHLIIAGNVVTPEAAIFLYKAGADVVKVGVGPGSICITRVVAGIGIPQLSAILAVGQAAKEHGFHVIADGGLQFSGDITKALAAGASAVMTGSLLAGTEEAPGERLLYGGREYKVYRGMGSIGAMQRGSKERYGQQKRDSGKLVPEGIEGRVPYRGTVADVIFQLTGGLRAGMGYVGAPTINELHKKARFVRVSAAGQRESHVHDITITKEAPNYHVAQD